MVFSVQSAFKATLPLTNTKIQNKCCKYRNDAKPKIQNAAEKRNEAVKQFDFRPERQRRRIRCSLCKRLRSHLKRKKLLTSCFSSLTLKIKRWSFLTADEILMIPDRIITRQQLQSVTRSVVFSVFVKNEK